MRYTLQAWWCTCGKRNEAALKKCWSCTANRIERYAQVAESERAVIYVNPLTGERRTPARADQAMPEVYARQGFERQEIMSMTEFEKKTGLVHEATNFAPGNEPSPDREPPATKAPKEVIDSIIDDIRAANQSGSEWTLNENAPSVFAA